jgi:hypothetical protein
MTSTLHLKDIFPKDWLDNDGKGDVYISAYHCLTNLFDNPSIPFYTGTVMDTKYLILKTKYQYQEVINECLGLKNGIPNMQFEIKTKVTDETPIIMFLLKHNGYSEYEVVQKLQAARGFLTLIEGENSHYWHLTDRIFHFPKENDSVLGKSYKSPESKIAFNKGIQIDDFSKKVESLDENIQNRIHLAMRWLDGAKHEQNSLDEFLKLWFAIETLIMPDTSNIKPIKDFLQSAYSLDSNTISYTFNIGKIFNLRSKIVHEGKNIGIHSQLIEYLKGLVYDYICHITNSVFEKRALSIINDRKFPVHEWMP